MTAARPERMPAAVYVAVLGFGAVFVQTSVINISLPDLRADLDPSLAGLQWAVNAFLLGLASMLIPAGVLSDRIGAARAFRLGLWAFGGGLALVVAAPAIGWVVAGQAAAGVGGALVLPSTTTIVVESTTVGAQRARAIGLLGIGASLGYGIGLAASGVLGAIGGWRLAIALPLCCALLLLTIIGRVVQPSVRRPERSADPRAVVVAIVAVAALVFALTDGNTHGWLRAPVFIALAVSAAAGTLFGLIELRVAHPLLPARLFAAPRVRLIIGFGALHNATIFGVLFVFVLALPALTHVSPLQLGVMMLPQAIGAGSFALISARWVVRRGPGPPLIVGSLLCALGMAIVASTTTALVVPVGIVGLLVMGAGGGLVVPALTSAITLALPADLTATGAAALNAGRQLGGVLGIAVIGASAAITDPLIALRVGCGASAVLTVVVVALGGRSLPSHRPPTGGAAEDQRC